MIHRLVKHCVCVWFECLWAWDDGPKDEKCTCETQWACFCVSLPSASRAYKVVAIQLEQCKTKMDGHTHSTYKNMLCLYGHTFIQGPPIKCNYTHAPSARLISSSRCFPGSRGRDTSALIKGNAAHDTDMATQGLHRFSYLLKRWVLINWPSCLQQSRNNSDNMGR